GVVGCRRRHAMERGRKPPAHGGVKIIDGKRPCARIAANLVQCDQAVETIERCVLKRLGRHRAGKLLDLECKTANARCSWSRTSLFDDVEREHVAKKIE